MTTELYITNSGNSMCWYRNGEKHNKFGPAIILPSGTKAWYDNGYLHRIDNPAVECADGYKEWWISGVEHSYLEYLVALEEFTTNKENT